MRERLWTHLEQVVHTPGKDDDVVDIEQGHNHDGGVTDAWREEEEKQVGRVATRGGTQNQECRFLFSTHVFSLSFVAFTHTRTHARGSGDALRFSTTSINHLSGSCPRAAWRAQAPASRLPCFSSFPHFHPVPPPLHQYIYEQLSISSVLLSCCHGNVRFGTPFSLSLACM